MSKYEPTYWNRRGNFQSDYNRLFDELVPHEGEAPTVAGELLRCVSALYYDRMNNGCANADLEHFGEYADFVWGCRIRLTRAAQRLGNEPKAFLHGLRAFCGMTGNKNDNPAVDLVVDVVVKYAGEAHQAGEATVRA